MWHLLGKFPRLTCVEILQVNSLQFPYLSPHVLPVILTLPLQHDDTPFLLHLALSSLSDMPSLYDVPFPRLVRPRSRMRLVCPRSRTCPLPSPRSGTHTPLPRLVLGREATRCHLASHSGMHRPTHHARCSMPLPLFYFYFLVHLFSFSFLLSLTTPLLSYVHGDPSCSPLRHMSPFVMSPFVSSPFVVSPLPLLCCPALVVSPLSSRPRPRPRCLILILAISPAPSPSLHHLVVSPSHLSCHGAVHLGRLLKVVHFTLRHSLQTCRGDGGKSVSKWVGRVECKCGQ